MRTVLESLDTIVTFLVMVVGSYLYIKGMAGGIGWVPVMFAPVSASTPAHSSAAHR